MLGRVEVEWVGRFEYVVSEICKKNVKKWLSWIFNHVNDIILQHLEGKKVTPDHGNLLLSEYFGRQEKKSIVLVVDEVGLNLTFYLGETFLNALCE